MHYRHLQLYLSLGLKLKKIRRALEVQQSKWLEKYISFNTQMRARKENTDFEKDFFKLMNNSVFGKTMENLRKRSNVKLVTDEREMVKLASRPTYLSHKIFHENLVTVNTKPVKVKLDKPSYVGMSILDLSKTLMYDFHYNYIKKKYSDQAQLLFTDTDSVTYHIKTEDAYRDFYGDRELFDDYPKDSSFYFSENKKVIGKFKDEAAAVPILEFVGLKSKMYSYLKDNDQNSKTAKGVKKVIDHQYYLDVLRESRILHHQMKTIRSYCHQISSFQINKISLSCFDDKRYLHHNGISSYAYGNLNIN